MSEELEGTELELQGSASEQEEDEGPGEDEIGEEEITEVSLLL